MKVETGGNPAPLIPAQELNLLEVLHMLRAIGVVRKLDNLGRIVIPKDIRRTKGWNTGDPIEFSVDDGGRIVLQKHVPALDNEKDS